MSRAWLRCLGCDEAHPLVELYRCPRCGGELDVRYDLALAAPSFERSWRGGGSLWSRFGALLPQADPGAVVGLGEGGTPLVRADRLAHRLGVDELWLKLESCNPTGSFKDRQVAVGLSKAREWGRARFATVSSGNVAVALAAYCARAGAEALVWVAGDSPEPKLDQVRVYGARLFVLPDPRGPSGAAPYVAAVEGLQAFALAAGLVPMVSARPVNPYMVEGAKTVAYELAAELSGAPDLVAAPVGGGGVVGGLWKGFGELRDLGLIEAPPRMLGAQRRAYFVPLDALDDPAYRDPTYYRPLDGVWAKGALDESGGRFRQVGDDAIREAQSLLATLEGVFAEPRGAYALAGLLREADEGGLAASRVACIVSGTGLKDMEVVPEIVRRPGHPPAESVVSLEDGMRRLEERRDRAQRDHR